MYYILSKILFCPMLFSFSFQNIGECCSIIQVLSDQSILKPAKLFLFSIYERVVFNKNLWYFFPNNMGDRVLVFCPKSNNIPCLKAREITWFWTKQEWKYSLVSLITILITHTHNLQDLISQQNLLHVSNWYPAICSFCCLTNGK